MEQVLQLFIEAVTIVLTGVVTHHAYREWKEGLVDYLARLVGFTPQPWMKPAFTLLAIINILGPWYLGLFFPELRGFFWSWSATAVATDIALTHLIPSLVSRENSPATDTWLTYVPTFVAICLAMVAGGYTGWSWGHLLGFISFAGLWPMLLVFRLTYPLHPRALTPHSA